MLVLRVVFATVVLSMSLAPVSAHHAAVSCGSGKTCERAADKDSGH